MAAKEKKKANLQIIVSNETTTLYENTTEDIIHINESKARLIYQKHLRKNNQPEYFWTCLALFVTCLVAVLTAEFKDVLGIQGSGIFLFSIFIIGTVLSFGFMLYFFIKWLVNRKKYSEDTFIKDLKEVNKKEVITK